MKCHLCGEWLGAFAEVHMKRFHAVRIIKQPARSKEEIVRSWESGHMSYLVFPEDRPDLKACGNLCRCIRCFDTAVTKLLKQSEADLDDSRNGAPFKHDLSGHII